MLGTNNNFQTRQRGFTLVELLAVVTIMTLVTTVGIPGAMDLVQNNRQTTVLNTLSHSFFAARSEAVTRASGISLCPSSNSSSCSGGTSWQNGWLIFTDEDRDGAIDSGTDEILKVFNKQGGATAVTGSQKVTYSPVGIVLTGTGLITLCDSRGATAGRGLSLASTGLVSALKDSNGDSVVDDGSGESGNISCD